MKEIVLSLFLFIFLPAEILAADAQSKVIKIGFIAPLSGAYADWGNKLKNGFLLALADARHEFKPYIHDGGNCEPRKAMTAVQNLISLHKIKIIVGPGCLSNLKAITPTAARNGAVVFSTGLLDDEAAKISSALISWATQISVEAKYLAKYMTSKGLRRIAIVHSSDAFGQEFADRMPEALTANNAKTVAIERVLLENTDFRSLISRLIKLQPDAIFLNLGEAQLASFAKQLRNIGSKLPLFSGYPAEAKTTIENGGEAVEGLTYTYQILDGGDQESRVSFDRKYQERFGTDQPATSTSYFVYDGMMQLDQALTKCLPADSQCIVSYFHQLGRVKGVSGVMTYNSDGTLFRPYGIKRVEKGKFVWVDKNLALGF